MLCDIISLFCSLSPWLANSNPLVGSPNPKIVAMAVLRKGHLRNISSTTQDLDLSITYAMLISLEYFEKRTIHPDLKLGNSI